MSKPSFKDALTARLKEKLGAKSVERGKNPLGLPWDFSDDVDWSTATCHTGPLYDSPGITVAVKLPYVLSDKDTGCGLVLSRREDNGETVISLCAKESEHATPEVLWVIPNDKRDKALTLLKQVERFMGMTASMADDPKLAAKIIKKMGTH